MEKNKLISFLNLIPDDVRCNIHGEYNGIGYECLVDVWCGKYLIRGWKDKIDNGSSIDEIMSSYVSDNWNCVSTDYDDDIVKGALFDSYIEEGYFNDDGKHFLDMAKRNVSQLINIQS